jgi:cell division protein FtsQ
MDRQARKAPMPRPPSTLILEPTGRRSALARFSVAGSGGSRWTLVRRFGLAALLGALCFGIVTGGGRQVRATAAMLPQLDNVLAAAGLAITQVELTGHRFTPDGDIFDALDLGHVNSMLSLDGDEACRRIERLPWIKTAAITRVYPNKLAVTVTERKAAAVWRRGPTTYLLDATGRVLSAVRDEPKDLPRFSGEGAATEASALLGLLSRYPAFAERMDVAERVGERRWTLHLKDGIALHLPAGGEAAALAELSDNTAFRKVLRGHDIIVDLRTPGRATVRSAGKDEGNEPSSDRAERPS